MLISTKGRYALRIMLDLAQQEPGAFIPLPAIAERQEASEKYLASIISTLARAGHALPEGQLLPDAAGLGKIRGPDRRLSRRSHADKPARRRRRDRRLPKREIVNILCCFHKPIDKVGFCAMINP